MTPLASEDATAPELPPKRESPHVTTEPSFLMAAKAYPVPTTVVTKGFLVKAKIDPPSGDRSDGHIQSPPVWGLK